MDKSLTITYLSVLVVLLAAAAWFVLRQVLKTRKVESRFSKLQKNTTKNNGTPEEYYELGSIYLEKSLFSQAVPIFKTLLKFKDVDEVNKALAYNALGFAYSAQEQYDLAIRQYKEALKFNPKYVTALNNIGFAYERKNLTAQALAAYEDALRYEPNNKTAQKRAESMRKRLTPSK